MTDLRRRLHRARRLLARYRRLAAAGLAALTVLALVHVLAPPPPSTSPVVVAAHELLGGNPLTPDDVRVVDLPARAVPAAALTSKQAVIGRTVAGPVDAAEMITAARLVGPSMVAGFGPAQVASPVRMSDADAAGLLRVGDKIDVYAATSAGQAAELVVAGASVAALPVNQNDVSRSEGALVVVAVSSASAARLAQEAARAPLSFTLLG